MTYPPPPDGNPDPYSPQPPQDPFAAPPASNPYAQPTSPAPSSVPPAAQPYGHNPPTTPYGQPPVSSSPYNQPYGQPQQQPYGYQTSPPQNSMALTAMILALVGIATAITAPIGAILGHVAMKQIRETGESGEGMAKTGIIVGWIITGIYALCCVGYLVFIVGMIGSAGLNGSGDF